MSIETRYYCASRGCLTDEYMTIEAATYHYEGVVSIDVYSVDRSTGYVNEIQILLKSDEATTLANEILRLAKEAQ